MLPPFRKISSKDLNESGRKRLCDWRKVMGEMEKELKNQGGWIENPSPLQVREMFNKARDVLPRDKKTNKGERRPSALSLQTVVNELRRKSSKERPKKRRKTTH